ncbi:MULTISPECIES: zinc-dependent peptidase [Halomonadaceae]|jgi:Mlc titration factor MtfA (ptsG expression regulator)|uniref:M90 family metallopeptidase n=1 Tax=Halomonadaceae TaxID=28256 RepID=UPI0015818E4B|nr:MULTISPECIES: M90 family metallopeptidase [Halomonas]MDI4638159.1 zinc-dependent peptidase [Halomonas sp. BMC7]NUJ59159.1 zinc-dependent peptidase [Halomonas taeanensis]|tara:strand:- start:17647 stop:18453 length:807 start_codon:yes stop_codon:yes gene_type:complete
MLERWRSWRAARFNARHPFPEDTWREARARLPLLAALSDEDAERLGRRAWGFVHDKRLSLHPALADTAFDEPARLALAGQACLLTLGWSQAEHQEAFANVHEILILPDAFPRHVEEMDEAGVMHEYADQRAGETSFQGPVVVAYPELMASGDFSGFNVLIHELAHKLDMGNSRDADGFPPLPRDMAASEWHRVFTAVWDDLQAHLARGEDTPIDDYAASHPGECFAVCCEHFFSAPDLLDKAYPALYSLLSRYFQQDPLARLPTPSHP